MLLALAIPFYACMAFALGLVIVSFVILVKAMWMGQWDVYRNKYGDAKPGGVPIPPVEITYDKYLNRTIIATTIPLELEP